MAKRRSRGEGGIRWSESRKRFIAEMTVGYTASGKRIVKSGGGKTETAARNALKDILKDYEDGLTSAENYTVADAVNDWLAYGQSKRSPGTVAKVTLHANNHIIPALGARRLASRTPSKTFLPTTWTSGSPTRPRCYRPAHSTRSHPSSVAPSTALCCATKRNAMS